MSALADLQAQWSNLPPRTRQLGLIGIAAVVFGILYMASWMPLQRDLKQLRVSVPREAEQLEWMRSQTPIAKALRARTSTTSSALVPGIEQSAASNGIRTYITKIESSGPNNALVTLEAAPFNTLISWLSDLQAAQGAVIDDANIEAHATAGLVNARLRLRSST